MQQNISNIPIYKNQDYAQTQANPNFSSTPAASNGAAVQNNPLLKQAENAQDGMGQIVGGGAAVTVGLLAGTSLLNNVLLKPDYDKSFLGWIERKGNALGTRPNVKKVTDAMCKSGNYIKTNIIDKSEILRTLFKKPSLGGPSVESQAAGATGSASSRAMTLMNKFVENKTFKDFDGIIAAADSKSFSTMDEILNAMKRMKGSSKKLTSFDSFITNIENNTFKNVDEVVKALKSHKISVEPAELKVFKKLIAKMSKNPHLHTKKIFEAIEKLPPALKDELLINKRPWWGLGLVKQKENFYSILNKHKLIKNYKNLATAAGNPAKSTLGSKLVGYLFRGGEALSNGLLGGPASVIMQAVFISMSLNEARKAEKGEKTQTFLASLADLMAMMGLIGVQQKVVSHLAGLKNIGMTPDQYKKYRQAIRVGNAAAKIGNTKAHNLAKLTIENLKVNVSKNMAWYQKPFKFIGKIVGLGRMNEMIKPMKGNVLAKIPYYLKFGLGYAGRAALIMGVILPTFSYLAKHASYAIFGKPKKTLAREKAKEEAEKKAQENPQPQQAEQGQTTNPLQQPIAPSQTPQKLPPAKPGNLVDYMNNKNKQQSPMGAQTIAPQTPDSPIAANTLKSPDAGIKRTYIPNPILAPEKSINNNATRTAKIDQVMRQADFAEAQAQKFL